MSRRKERAMHAHIVLDVECPRGHRVGIVAKPLDPLPDAGRYLVGEPLQFEEPPEIEDDTGRVRGSCPRCAADVQVSWRRLKAAFQECEDAGRHTGSIT